MSECMFCHGPLTGRRKTFCSDKCRMGHKRADKRLQDRVQSTNSGEPEQLHQPEHEQTRTTEPEQPYELKPEQTVYNRPAVSYDRDRFETRPEPLDITDRPCPRNRGRYTRLDGTQYQFDAIGQVFELTNGLVYQTVQDVMVAHAERKAQSTTAAPVDNKMSDAVQGQAKTG